MKKARLSIVIIFSIFISLIFTNVYAGSVNVSFSGNDTVYVGDTIDLIVNVSNINGLTNGMATLQADLIYEDGYLEYVNSQDVSDDLSVSYGTKTKRFVALGLGGESISSSGNLLKITFKAKTKGTTTVNLSNTVVGDTSAIVHTANVTPKKITIIDKEESSSEPSGGGSGKKDDTPSDSGSKGSSSTGTSKSSGTSSSSSKSSSSKSSDATLSKLLVNDSKMSPTFSKDVTSYNIEVASNVTKAVVDFVPTDSKAKAELIGNTTLGDGVTILQVVVTAEDGTKKTYTLNITKSTEESNSKLLLLNVSEADNLDFDEDTYSYRINVKNNVKKLTIDAIPKAKGSKVTILGNGKLSTGSNMVVVKVTDKNGFSSYYKLNVNRSDKITLFGIDIIYWFIILFGLLFLLLLILFLWKRRKEEEEEEQEPKTIKLEVVNKEEENKDIYDDIVTKDEIIEAIEEKNSKKLKMLLTQEEANRLKDELKKEEKEETPSSSSDSSEYEEYEKK